MYFTLDVLAFFIALIFIFALIALRILFRKYSDPKFHYSHLKDLEIPTNSSRVHFSKIPKQLMYLGWCLFLLAFIDPRIEGMRKTEPIEQDNYLSHEGLAIYLVLDQSGSMGSHVIHEISEENIKFPIKLDLLKDVSEKFIEERKGDLIGLVSFARTAQVLVPLTLDHEDVIKNLQQLQVEKRQDQNATAIGYAIYKTAHLIAATRNFSKERIKKGAPSYDIKGGVMILVTDGFQNPHPNDKGNSLRTMGIEEASQKAKEENVHLYIISIEPSINESEFAPHRRLMERSAALTGGQFFTAEDPNELPKIYKKINQLEKSSFVLAKESLEAQKTRLFSFYPYLIFFGLLSLFSGFLLETTLLRKAP